MDIAKGRKVIIGMIGPPQTVDQSRGFVMDQFYRNVRFGLPMIGAHLNHLYLLGEIFEVVYLDHILLIRSVAVALYINVIKYSEQNKVLTKEHLNLLNK